MPVNSRVMIDAMYFREANPNYNRPRINNSIKQDSSDRAWIFLGSDKPSTNQSNQVKSNGKVPTEMTEDDLILCSPTVTGFIYDNKLWGKHSFPRFAVAGGDANLIRRIAEFAVADIKDINWNPAAFAHLAIPSKQKEII